MSSLLNNTEDRQPSTSRLTIYSVALLGAFLCSSVPSEALGLDRQLLLGGHLSYAHEFAEAHHPGGGAGLHVWYGLTDAVAVGGQLAWAGHAAPGNADADELRNVMTAAAGLYFVLDIMRIVPYLGVLSGAAVSLQDNVEASYLLGLSGGADMMLTPSMAMGVELTYQFLVGRDLLPARLVASLRLSWRHIFF